MTGTPANSGAGMPPTESSLEELRAILVQPERRSVDELRAALDGLQARLDDETWLAAAIAPILSEALRLKIRDARDEMIEALYPIIGQTVVRAVSEAVRDLARTVDAQMRATIGPRQVWRRLQARLRGVSGAELALRDALSFTVSQVFLIHQESGLLLQHVARDTADADTDLIGAMLTAIRDFTEEAFGDGRPEDLDAIQVGDRRILIEAAQRVYLAAVVDGVEPAGFRALMRDCVVAIAQDHAPALRDYDGDATPFDAEGDRLRRLLATEAGDARGREETPAPMSRGQKVALGGLLALALACCGATYALGRWGWAALNPPPPLPTATATATGVPPATAAPTATATATATPTATPTTTPTATPTATQMPAATAVAPIVGAMTGNAFVHEAPALTASRTGAVIRLGHPVEVLALSGAWAQVRWTTVEEGERTGWVQLAWVATLDPIPGAVITPQAGP